jgi:hypothetical protein
MHSPIVADNESLRSEIIEVVPFGELAAKAAKNE